MAGDERWLVVRGGALGDFVVAEPAMSAVRARAGRLVLAARPRFVPLLRRAPDETIDLHGPGALWLFGGAPPPALPDAALVFTPGVAERLRALGVPRVVDASGPVEGGAPAHEQLWRRAREAVGDGPAPAPRVAARREPPVEGTPIVLAPGAGGVSRRYERMIELAEEIGARGVPWVWVPGLGDPVPEGVPALPGLGLEELAALAASCACWVGNDTGTTHLAAAAGAPVVALFGPTDPTTWAPPGATVLPLDAEPAEIAVVVGRIACGAVGG